jgi:hypothetical protein
MTVAGFCFGQGGVVEPVHDFPVNLMISSIYH